MSLWISLQVLKSPRRLAEIFEALERFTKPSPAAGPVSSPRQATEIDGGKFHRLAPTIRSKLCSGADWKGQTDRERLDIDRRARLSKRGPVGAWPATAGLTLDRSLCRERHGFDVWRA